MLNGLEKKNYDPNDKVEPIGKGFRLDLENICKAGQVGFH